MQNIQIHETSNKIKCRWTVTKQNVRSNRTKCRKMFYVNAQWQMPVPYIWRHAATEYNNSKNTEIVCRKQKG